MRKLFFLLLLFFVACKFSQVPKSNYEITSKKALLFEDYSFVINKVISDSRCPEGTNCIWSGELIIELSVWQKNKLIQTNYLNFSPKTKDENLLWFSKFIPKGRTLRGYRILPLKTENSIELKEYTIELILE